MIVTTIAFGSSSSRAMFSAIEVMSPDDPPTNKASSRVSCLADHAHIERARKLVLPDSFNLVRRPFHLVLTFAPPVLGQYRAGRITCDHSYLLASLFEIAANASARPACAGRTHAARDLSAGL